MFWARVNHGNGKLRHVFYDTWRRDGFVKACDKYTSYDEIMLDRDPNTPRPYCKRCVQCIGIQHDGYVDYATRSLMPPEG